MRSFYEAVSRCNPEKQNLAVTVLDGLHFGEKALFSEGQLIFDTEKNGYLEEHAEEIWMAARNRCRDGIAEAAGTQVFCDWLGQENHLVICGGGHVSIPVIEIGRMLGFQVTVLEDRPVFADNARRAGANQVICESFAAGLDQIEGSSSTYFVLVTRGHTYDQICLEKIAAKPHAYIGMLGNRKRVQIVKSSVLEHGADPQVIGRVHTPIGLDISAETPAEVGVAIMAEIIQVKNRGIRKNGYSRDMLHALLKSREEGTVGVMAAIVRKKGSTPREAGNENAGTAGWPLYWNHRRRLRRGRYDETRSRAFAVRLGADNDVLCKYGRRGVGRGRKLRRRSNLCAAGTCFLQKGDVIDEGNTVKRPDAGRRLS